MPIIAPIPRDERRLMKKAIHETRDKNHARRLTAILMLHRGDRVSDVARTLCCARSSVGRWINWFKLSGVDGLKSLPAGRSRRWPFEHICTLLRELIKHTPADFGYQRSRWLPVAGLVWRRAAQTLRIRDPHNEEKIAAIHKALYECSAEHPVFYEDEVDSVACAWCCYRGVYDISQHHAYCESHSMKNCSSQIRLLLLYKLLKYNHPKPRNMNVRFSL